MIYNENCLKTLKGMKAKSIDLVCTDPPYGISFMGKEWDKALPDVKVWLECYRVLKPASFMFVMCIPRQDCLSRMIISLEDAGFKVNFTSLYHAFGSGFPKASNISKMVDKRFGAERKGNGQYKTRHGGGKKSDKIQQINPDWKETEITSNATPQAKALDGYYAGFQPKPALEVIIVVQKPMTKKSYVDQALLSLEDEGENVGSVNFENTRIPYESEGDSKATDRANTLNSGQWTKDRGNVYGKYDANEKPYDASKGRFPANLLVSDDVLNTGENSKSEGGNKPINTTGRTYSEYNKENQIYYNYQDSGSFSRYFSLDAWWDEKLKAMPERVKRTFPFLVTPKPAKSEKQKGVGFNGHPTVKSVKLMSYLIALGSKEGDTIYDPYCGSATTLVACELLARKGIGSEINKEYFEIAKKRLFNEKRNLKLF